MKGASFSERGSRKDRFSERGLTQISLGKRRLRDKAWKEVSLNETSSRGLSLTNRGLREIYRSLGKRSSSEKSETSTVNVRASPRVGSAKFELQRFLRDVRRTRSCERYICVREDWKRERERDLQKVHDAKSFMAMSWPQPQPS